MFYITAECRHRKPSCINVRLNKMLKPEKWQAASDGDGRVCGFQKLLKLIVLGGVDPSIRPEVWEFLLGCYTLNTTAEYRRKLRTARRERYGELIKHCQKMHSSIGTGSLAFVIGSKVMDVRTFSKEDGRSKADVQRTEVSEDTSNCKDTDLCEKESSSGSSEHLSVRESTEDAALGSSGLISGNTRYSCSSLRSRTGVHGSQSALKRFLDFPALPVTDWFERSDELEKQCELDNGRNSAHLYTGFNDGVDENMHSFHINGNENLIVASNSTMCDAMKTSMDPEIDMVRNSQSEQLLESTSLNYESNIERGLRISDATGIQAMGANTSKGEDIEDSEVEWLWTLHRIVVDVVRTDSHLHFYEDQKNLARMSDILAVYAWVDPVTGYCQGMSDLLSPFVVLFEDDADAFWCFEMLLRRTRENFRMEGSTGVIKQLQTLWHILEFTDREMFAHLSQIGAESLHFAFRMLLVLFRRELSFSESLRMWEMMWAADFDESLARDLESRCLDSLVLQLPEDLIIDIGDKSKDCDGSLKAESQGNHVAESHANHVAESHGNHVVVKRFYSRTGGLRSACSSNSFCGLTRSFWSWNGRMQTRAGSSTTKNRGDELPVFCVAAILILNRHKIIEGANSIDDLIKIFNDNLLTIKVKRSIRTAIKLRQKFNYKVAPYEAVKVAKQTAR
ncbi:hypothetical protein Droror1_Dr00026793 [Drosera rotundifolia]